MAQAVKNIKCLLKTTFQNILISFFSTASKIFMAVFKSYRDLMSPIEIKMSYPIFTLPTDNNPESFLRTRSSGNRQGQAVPFVHFKI